jgi:hypothetical protein
MQKLGKSWLPPALLIAAVLVAAFFSRTATERTLSGLESVLLQMFALVAGVTGSYLVGKQSASDAAREIMKPHARSAFRRLMSLYASLSRVLTEIAAYNAGGEKNSGQMALARLEGIVIEQIATADDALEDWIDIVPEEVKELREKLEKAKEAGVLR